MENIITLSGEHLMESVSEYFSQVTQLTEQSEWTIHQDIIFRQTDDRGSHKITEFEHF